MLLTIFLTTVGYRYLPYRYLINLIFTNLIPTWVLIPVDPSRIQWGMVFRRARPVLEILVKQAIYLLRPSRYCIVGIAENIYSISHKIGYLGYLSSIGHWKATIGLF